MGHNELQNELNSLSQELPGLQKELDTLSAKLPTYGRLNQLSNTMAAAERVLSERLRGTKRGPPASW